MSDCAGEPGKVAPVVDRNRCETKSDCVRVCPYNVFDVRALTDDDRAALSLIVAHNHPVGGLEPSPADVEATKQLKAAGSVMGIALLDHIIFNRTGYFSFLEAGRL